MSTESRARADQLTEAILDAFDAEDCARRQMRKDPANTELRLAYEEAKEKRIRAQIVRSEYRGES